MYTHVTIAIGNTLYNKRISLMIINGGVIKGGGVKHQKSLKVCDCVLKKRQRKRETSYLITFKEKK